MDINVYVNILPFDATMTYVFTVERALDFDLRGAILGSLDGFNNG